MLICNRNFTEPIVLNTGYFKDVEILPSYYFLPKHGTGLQYMGHSKVYAYQEWGSTKQNYETMNQLFLPNQFITPKKSISVLVSSLNTQASRNAKDEPHMN